MFSVEEAKQLVATVKHWDHRFEIFPGVVTPGVSSPEDKWKQCNLEHRVTGKRVLEVGALNGAHSLKLKQLGANLISVDYRENAGFRVMERLAGQRFNYLIANVYDLNSDDLGVFEIILFLGVLYHLADMFRALYVLRQLCAPGALFLLETTYEPHLHPEQAVARYYIGDSFKGDANFWWNPNRRCVHEMLHDSGFDVVRDKGSNGRLLVEATASAETGRLWKISQAYGAHPRGKPVR
jgi:tRNA (mo5U34)-methyltransferase